MTTVLGSYSGINLVKPASLSQIMASLKTLAEDTGNNTKAESINKVLEEKDSFVTVANDMPVAEKKTFGTAISRFVTAFVLKVKGFFGQIRNSIIDKTIGSITDKINDGIGDPSKAGAVDSNDVMSRVVAGVGLQGKIDAAKKAAQDGADQAVSAFEGPGAAAADKALDAALVTDAPKPAAK